MTNKTWVCFSVALVSLSGCVYEFADSYEVTVVTTLESAAGAPVVTESTETIVVEQEDAIYTINELRLVRESAGAGCEILVKRRGGCGLQVASGQSCTWRGGVWSTTGGRAADDCGEDLVLTLKWDLGDDRRATEVLTFVR